MNSEQEKQVALRLIDQEHQDLLKLEAGRCPAWLRYHGAPDVPLSLEERWQYADWSMKNVLDAVLPILPPDLQTAAQTCLKIRNRIWSHEYRDAYYQRQNEQESSPASATGAGQPEVAG